MSEKILHKYRTQELWEVFEFGAKKCEEIPGNPGNGLLTQHMKIVILTPGWRGIDLAFVEALVLWGNMLDLQRPIIGLKCPMPDNKPRVLYIGVQANGQ